MAKNRRSNVVDMPRAFDGQDAPGRPGSAVDTDAIRRRAYEIYESRGCTDGSDVEDWLRAERELNAMAVKAS